MLWAISLPTRCWSNSESPVHIITECLATAPQQTSHLWRCSWHGESALDLSVRSALFNDKSAFAHCAVKNYFSKAGLSKLWAFHKKSLAFAQLLGNNLIRISCLINCVCLTKILGLYQLVHANNVIYWGPWTLSYREATVRSTTWAVSHAYGISNRSRNPGIQDSGKLLLLMILHVHWHSL